MKSNYSKDGFTIIETSLVLAIAGLIFLMIFVALPTLQRQARDTQRREDMLNVLSAIKKFQQNNRGALPNGDSASNVSYSASASGNSWAGFYHDYLKEGFEDPNGDDYILSVVKCGTGTLATESKCDSIDVDSLTFPDSYTVHIIREATCDGETPVKSSNNRKVAVVYKFEGAGVYCGNS